MSKHSDAVRGRQAKARLLVTLYALSEARVMEIIREALERRETDLSTLTRRRRRIVIEITNLRSRTEELVRDLLRSAFGVGESEASRVLQRRSRRPLSATTTTSLDILIDNLSGTLHGAAVLVGRQAEDVLRREGLRGAFRSLEADQPEGVASDEMVRRLQREGVTGFIDRAGRRWKLSTYAEMAVRTTSAEALAQGTAQKMLERGFDLVEVSSHSCDHHPSDPDNPCRRLEGKTLSLTGATPGYERLKKLCPWHPRCTHFVTPSPANFAVDVPELVAA